MFRQCWQIFLTSVRWWIFWPVALFYLIGWAFLANGIYQKHHGTINSELPNVASGFIFLLCFFGMIVFELKLQLSRPQASIIPGYRVPHLVTALVLSLPVWVVAPVVASVGFGLPILPLLSLNIVYCALAAWAIYRNTTIPILVANACLLAPAIPQVNALLLNRFITDHSLINSLAALPVLALGVAGFVVVARGLLALREEMPEYARNMAVVPTNRSIVSSYAGGAATVRQVNWDSRWIRWLYAPNERELARGDRIGSYLEAGFWQRVAHQRTAYLSQRTALPMMLLFVIMMGTIFAFSSRHESNGGGSLLFLMPTYLAFLQQYGRWPTLGVESLRPGRRRDFVLEYAAQLVWNVAEAWLIVAAGFLVTIAALAPGNLGQSEFWMILAASVVVQALTLPMAWWLLRLYSAGVLICIAIGSAVTFGPFAIFIVDVVHFSPRWLAAGAGTAMLLGAIIALDAYRRWMRTDLA